MLGLVSLTHSESVLSVTATHGCIWQLIWLHSMQRKPGDANSKGGNSMTCAILVPAPGWVGSL